MDGCTVQVLQVGGGYQLALPSEVAGSSHERVLEVAVAFVELINGAASLLIDSYRPIELAKGAFFGVDADGTVLSTVVPVGAAEERCKAGHITAVVGGATQPDSRRGQLARFVESARRSVAAKDALALVGRPSPTWSELYLIYELVEANVGGRMYSDGWISRSQGERFARTANSYTALGRASRHGRQTSQPPGQPMTQREATQLMRTLVQAWLTQPMDASAG